MKTAVGPTRCATRYPRVAQRDAHLAKTALDEVSAMCQLLSWNPRPRD